jgi:small ubiquitin-related modifier
MLSPALTYGEGRFVFDGGRVNGEKTPEDYDMVSGDKIDFFPDLMGA